jgi:alpha-galactosidase
MWHSWYAHADRINDEQIRDDVDNAAELGVETIQFDAGWNVPWEEGYALAREGDYVFDSGRFPDPVGLIDYIHQKGIRVILHVAPLSMGPHAKAYPTMKDCVMMVNGKPDAWEHIDPRLKKTHDYLLAAWEKMILEYKIDGLWYDFLEIPESAGPPAEGLEIIETNLHIAYSKLLESLYKRALELNPDFVIITRRGPANLNSKLHCTHVWPSDVPQDYNMNRRDVIFMKTFGTGVLTHACCTSWAISETDDNIARQMASITLAGVPSFTEKLAESPDSHNKIIKAWLKYYKENKQALMLGTMTPLLPTPPSAALRIEYKNQAFFGLFEVIPGLLQLSQPADKVTIVNAYSDRLVTRLEGVSGQCKIKVYDQLWNLISEQTMKTDAKGINLNITGPSAVFSVIIEQQNRP